MQITFTETDLQMGSVGHQALKALLNIMTGEEPEHPFPTPERRTQTLPETEPKEPAHEEAAVPCADQDKSEKTYTLEEVRSALSEVAKKEGKELAKGLLAAFDVNKVTDLEPAHYAEMMRGIREVL